jgi:hypothetical protein
MSKDVVYRIVSSENISYTGTAANGAATITHIRQVRVVATTDCWVAIGPSATATTSSTFLPAFVPEYFRVGGGERVSAIRDVTSGTLNVSYLSQ